MKAHSRKWYATSLVLAGVLVLGSTLVISAQAATGETGTNQQIADALQGDWGKINFNLRYRYEYVDQDGLKSTDGDTIRLRLGYLTPKFAGFQAFAEFEGNAAVFSDSFNDKTNGKTEYAVIADPDEAELNQGWLSYSGIPDTNIKAGRQKIVLDNQRFIGAVGWRQMEQTFDSVNVINTSLGNFNANLTYIWNVRSILSKDINMQSPVVNLSYAFKDVGKLTGYGYWLDYDDADDSGLYANSTETYGLRFNGSMLVAENLKVLYTGEYAYQSDYGDNPADYSADYYHFVGGLQMPNKGSLFTNITGKIGYELLGSDDGVSFRTPLGTNHAFNGWVDKFLTTPADGLQDTYGVLSTAISGFKLKLVYHDFQADEGGADYGTEFDAMVSKKFFGHYTLLAAYGNYDADDLKTDTEKVWIQLAIAF